MALPRATTPDQRGPESDGNKGVLRIPQSSSISGASPSNCLVSYSGHSFGESCPSAQMVSVYSTVPADRAIVRKWWIYIYIYIYIYVCVCVRGGAGVWFKRTTLNQSIYSSLPLQAHGLDVTQGQILSKV